MTTAILVRERVAQRIKNRTWLNEYSCPQCGVLRLATHARAKESPKCIRCSRKKEHRDRDDGRHKAWNSMKQRCTNPNRKEAHNYVLRGISLCKEWMTYDGFKAWDKFDEYRPGLQIDRIDNDKGYSPENCRWVTHAENSRNRRTNKLSKGDIYAIRMLCWSGLSLLQVGRIFGVHKATIGKVMNFRLWDDAKPYRLKGGDDNVG